MSDRLSKAEFGSDLIVEMLNDLEIPLVSLNPGSSFRGLHDSLVNFPGAPEMVVSPHEEIAIAVAHGWARVTGKPLACGIHDVVGLQHASMAMYNAWCDRIPMMVLGATGRHPAAVAVLTALAELLAAPVVSNGARYNFASNHPLNVTHLRQDAIGQADVLLALDVFDLSATLGVGIGSQRSSGALRPE